MFGQIGSIDAIGKIDDQKKFQRAPEQQPQVAFVNSIFDNFGGNSSSTETAFNA